MQETGLKGKLRWRSEMTQVPYASVRDLLSTGYCFEELKNFTEAKEIDLSSFSRAFAVPYLSRQFESCQRSGQTDRSKILSLAVKFLCDANDDEMTDIIFALRNVALSEIEMNEKALHQSDQLDRVELVSCRRKSEAAQTLGKLLTCIIRAFKLAEVTTKRGKSSRACGSVGDAVKEFWEVSLPQKA